MFFSFFHSRPMLRILVAMVLFAGFLGTAAATHASLTSGYSQAVAVDMAGGDLDWSGLDDNVSAEDNMQDDMLDRLDALTVHPAWLGELRPMTAHAAPAQWHASSELRPPIA
jgi:hypothetical protein